MRQLVILSALFSSVSGVGNVVAQDVEWLPANMRVASQHIVPKYQAVATASKRLLLSVNGLCEGDSDVVIDHSTRKEFKKLLNKWAQVQHLQLGPITFLKRYERFNYWPDKHKSGERQLRNLLAEGTENLSLKALQGKSIAVQGISALERLLFSKKATLNENECALAQLISENLDQIMQQVDQNWRLPPVDFAKEFELAERESGTYSSSKEIATILANSLTSQLLLIAEYKLGKALPKKQGGRAYTRQLEAWRSQSSFGIIENSLKSLRALYRTGFRQLTKTSNKGLNQRIEKQFSTVIRFSKQMPSPLSYAYSNEAGVKKVKALQRDILALEVMIRVDMFNELEFVERFNSLDGD